MLNNVKEMVRMKNCLYLTFCVFPLLFSTLAYGQDNCETTPPNWDWNKTSYEVIDDSPGPAQRLSPFVDGNAFGISLAGQKHCYEDGWRLYQKKMSCTDYAVDCETAKAVSDEEFRSIFSLYNIHAGVLRTFIHTRGFEIDDQQLRLDVELTYGNSGKSNLGYMLNSKTPIVMLDEKYDLSNTSNENNATVFPSFAEKWIVFDKHLSYDPSDDNFQNDLQITVNMSRINSSEVKIKGLLEFTTTGTIGSSSPSSNSIGVSDLIDVYTSYGDPGKWASDIEEQASKLTASNSSIKIKAGAELTAIAATLSAYSTPLGYANAASTVYNLLSGSFSPSSSSYVNLYSEGTISLEGEIIDTAPIETVAIGIHGSPQSVEVDESILEESGYTGKLGLVSFNDRPRMIVTEVKIAINSEICCEPVVTYSGYLTSINYRLIDNIEDLVLINPSSGMYLKNYALQPVASLLTSSGEATSAYNVLTNSDYTQCLYINRSISFYDCINQRSIDSLSEKETSNEISSKYMYSPKDKGLSYLSESISYNGSLEGSIVTELPVLRSVNYDPAWDISFQHKLALADMFLNVYLYLEHKDKPEIYSELKVRIPVNIGLCNGTSAAYFEMHDDSEFFTATSLQCSGQNDTDMDGFSDNEEISKGTNPYLNYDFPPPEDNCGSCHL